MAKSRKVHFPGPNERIKAPGVYQISLTKYHGDCAVLRSVSSGGLVQISESGEEYYETSPYNPDYKPSARDHKPHFRFGNAAHALIVGGQDWDERFIVSKNWKDWRSEKARDWRWREEVRNGKVCLLKRDEEHLLRMRDKILAHDRANKVFATGVPEVSMFVKLMTGVSNEGIMIKSRPDVLPLVEHSKRKGFWYISDNVVSDYKTINDNSIPACDAAIKKYGYDRKLANVGWCICKLFGLEWDDLEFALIFQKTTPPYGITIRDFDNRYMRMLVSKNLGAARKFEEGIQPIDGKWDGYAEEIVPYRIKKWDYEQLENDIKAGKYPEIDSNLNIIGEQTS